jgi:alanyl-tRNA synthetase
VTWTEVPSQIRHLQDRTRDLEREIGNLRGQLAGAKSGDLIDQAIDVAGIRVLSSRVEIDSKDDLRQLGDRLRDSLQSGVIVLGAVTDDKPSLLVMVTPDVVTRGVKAGDIVRQAVTHIDGRGGGRPELAEAGGKNPAGLDDALEAVSGIVSSMVV